MFDSTRALHFSYWYVDRAREFFLNSKKSLSKAEFVQAAKALSLGVSEEDAATLFALADHRGKLRSPSDPGHRAVLPAHCSMEATTLVVQGLHFINSLKFG
jgi:hypothetical protein